MGLVPSKKKARQKGLVVLMFGILSTTLLTFVALSVDLGRVYDERRKIQIAADAASFAAVNALGESATYSSVVSVITDLVEANGVSVDEVMEDPPRCGTWDGEAFIPHDSDVCDETSTAVEVTVRRKHALSFGRVVYQRDLDLHARSISYKPLPPPGNCIRPFGVEDSFLSHLNVREGGSFTVRGTQESGNWGKIDIYGNASSGEEYSKYMLENLCDEQIAAGNSVSAGTGNAEIWKVFETLMGDTTAPYASEGMVFAVTSDFGNGNKSVQIHRFIRVDLLSQSGRGQNWAATFRVVDLDAEPDPPPQPERKLMQ